MSEPQRFHRSWRERLIAWRNGLVRDPRFQRWAASFPLTKRVAQRRARALFDLCAGFVYSQTVLAAVQLGLFEMLADGALSIDDAAEKTGLDRDAAATLLRAGASLDLFERVGGRVGGERFALGELGAALLGNPAVMRMIEHHPALYADLADPVALLRERPRETALARFWGYAREAAPAALSPDRVDAYSRLMAASQSFIASDILDAFSFRNAGRLLDVGGGAGAFAVAALRRAPALRATVFDLPAVAAIAQARFASEALADRAEAIGGDFHADALPAGADVLSFVRVLHDHDDDAARALIASAHAALGAGGTLLIAEPMAGTAGAPAMGAAYFGVYLFAMGSGRPRTAEELLGFVADAGFRSAQIIRTPRPMLVRLIAAQR